MNNPTLLADIWMGIAALTLLLYVVLDGFDLGVGILSLFACDEDRRTLMMTSLGSVWDANETWLVLLGGILFGAFPALYAALAHGLYLPIMLMLLFLALRGVAFEFRALSRRKSLWNLAFGLGSLGAAAMQGIALGAVIDRPIAAGAPLYSATWPWIAPFPLLVGAGVVAGYGLMGATWLILKTTGEMQSKAYARARILLFATLAAGALTTLITPWRHLYVASKWFGPDAAYLVLLPMAALYAAWRLARSLTQRRERSPFLWSLIIFIASFTGLVLSLHPYAIPEALTWREAAASSQTLIFMLVGIVPLVPIMLVYNAYQYRVFRGKVQGHDASDTHFIEKDTR
ncbi:MAG: cytochrome d ubiquinol oxidase subunit II [Thiobacillus sp.]